MKKILLSITAMSLFAVTIISCQSNQKGTQEAATDSTETSQLSEDTVDKAKARAIEKNTGIKLLEVSPNVKVQAPQFSNEDVNNGFAEFEPLKQEYIAAINSNDAAKIKEVNARYISWVKKAAAWGSKITKDENQSYIDHYTKLVTQWDKLSLRVKK